MVDREELGHLVYQISNDILDSCVCSVTGLEPGTIWADPFLADIFCYTGHGDTDDEDAEAEQIIDKICTRYKLRSLTTNEDSMVLDKNTLEKPEEFVAPISARMPLALMALYIILNGVIPTDLGDYKDE